MSSRALSREGYAAMSTRGETDRWILIQQNTFTNWVNEQLRIYNNELLEDLQTDFSDGVRLCYLVEALQGRKIGRIIKKPHNPHQNLENVTKALNAIANDNVRLVNIGSDDIVTGNLKLILGLVWHLILRYQIGKTKFPTKKLMLAWIQAVIPECGISNFTTDWNDGIALHALIDFCRPGLSSDWRHMSRSSALDNCRSGMQLAKDNFDIPLVVRPEDLTSPDLDELSGMTYLSYFMKIDSPGYHATLKIVQNLLQYGSCNNFTSDWQDGHLLSNLVKSLGESTPPLTGSNSENIQKGLEAAQRLGVNPILTAKEMCDPEVDHIGIMAYAAYFKNFKPTKTPAERVVLSSPPKNVYIGKEVSNFSVRIDDDSVSPSDVRAEIKGPDSSPSVRFNWTGSVGDGLFTPEETGLHRLSVFCNEQLILGCPVTFKAMADRSRITLSPVDSCPVGVITELKVDSTGAGQGDVRVEAQSPGGRVQNLTAVYRHGQYVINFSPTEVGVWNLSVLYDGEHISGSPYDVVVYDPASVRVYGLEGGSVGSDLSFHADASSAGDGDLKVAIFHEGSAVPSFVSEDRPGVNRINFTPQEPGIYKVHVSYNDNEVKGSPYTIEIYGSGRATATGDGLSLVPLNKTAIFNVDTQGSQGKVDVEITAPSKRTVPYNIRKISGGHTVEYIPTEVGDHKIEVRYADSEIDGSPFTAKAYDTRAIKVSKFGDTMVGQSVRFTIDVTNAGEGQLEIMVNNGNLPNTVEMETAGVYKIAFVPEQAGKQYVDINFNREPLPDSPFTCMAMDVSGALVRGLKSELPTDKATSFFIQADNVGTLEDTAKVEIFKFQIGCMGV